MAKKSKVGRKPVEDKAIGITVYIKESEVELMGGKDEARLVILNSWKSAVKKKKK